LTVNASVVVWTWVKALSGTALAGVEVDAVLADGVEGPGLNVVAGGVSAAVDGVYSTDVVVAFDPAEAEADAENDDTALAPVAPDEALD
jgi:hypothetical protein